MKHTVLRYGLIAGAILSALMVVTIGGAKLLGWEQSGSLGMLIGYTTMLLSFVMIHFGIRSYRDTVLGGTVRFWPAAPTSSSSLPMTVPSAPMATRCALVPSVTFSMTPTGSESSWQ